jgi:streptomycin 6-kinase
MPSPALLTRAESLARDWGLVVDEIRQTRTSLLLLGKCGTIPCLLKVSRQSSDEWHSGAVVRAFDGNGMVRAYDHREGTVLLERLTPATPLIELTLAGRDDEATDILADVIGRLSATQIPAACPTVQDWGKGFSRYLGTGDPQIPPALVERAQSWYQMLSGSQGQTRLLHGDLQHYNVLYDGTRGWLAIDPKGVVGEIEYELGASLRNPGELPARFASSRIVEKRLARFGARLALALDRALAWAYAQAVLSAIWEVEDDTSIGAGHPTIRLAQAIESMLPPAP